uniref:Sodium voltage-gated channel beta subunit 4 n=1 Tax=Oryzias sinensis TaxID=183150 RepID=A0A8C8DRM0_9TELE
MKLYHWTCLGWGSYHITRLDLSVWSVGGLEVTTGKVSLIEAVNGSTVLLPCNYHSCIGIKNLFFKWTFRNNGSEQALCEGNIPAEKIEPTYSISHDRVTFVGSSTTSNISILLWNITFEDEGQYICFARNPKEKNRNHSAVLTLRVVDQSTQQIITLLFMSTLLLCFYICARQLNDLVITSCTSPVHCYHVFLNHSISPFVSSFSERGGQYFDSHYRLCAGWSHRLSCYHHGYKSLGGSLPAEG